MTEYDPTPGWTAADQALLTLLDTLEDEGYDFVTPTPATHARVRARQPTGSDFSRDIFGWNRTFRRDQCPEPYLRLLIEAEALREDEGGLASIIRVSRLDGRLHLHSAPTRDRDAVFLGPDSYRFARCIDGVMAAGPLVRGALDIGVGPGPGALVIAARAPAARVIASDVNPKALRYAAINARHADLRIEPRLCSGPPQELRDLDLIVANPPYIAGTGGRTYRDGGDDQGTAMALDWVARGLGLLAPGGRFLLYTGAPVICGVDRVKTGLTGLVEGSGVDLAYEEIDPDVFGGTLARPSYAEVERIAAVCAVLTRS